MKMAKRKALHSPNTFINLGIRAVDNKHRININLSKLSAGKNIIAAKRYEVLVGKYGDILLRPLVTVPAREAWIYKNPEVIGRIRRGLNEAKEGKIERIENLDEFLEDL